MQEPYVESALGTQKHTHQSRAYHCPCNASRTCRSTVCSDAMRSSRCSWRSVRSVRSYKRVGTTGSGRQLSHSFRQPAIWRFNRYRSNWSGFGFWHCQR